MTLNLPQPEMGFNIFLHSKKIRWLLSIFSSLLISFASIYTFEQMSKHSFNIWAVRSTSFRKTSRSWQTPAQKQRCCPAAVLLCSTCSFPCINVHLIRALCSRAPVSLWRIHKWMVSMLQTPPSDIMTEHMKKFNNWNLIYAVSTQHSEDGQWLIWFPSRHYDCYSRKCTDGLHGAGRVSLLAVPVTSC